MKLVFLVSFSSSELTALLVKFVAHDRLRNFDGPQNKIGLFFGQGFKFVELQKQI